MKEKLSAAMPISMGIMILLLFLALVFPQLFGESADAMGFAKGIGAALGSCATGLLTAFKYNKNSSTDK